jgi:hypothetical protein
MEGAIKVAAAVLTKSRRELERFMVLEMTFLPISIRAPFFTSNYLTDFRVSFKSFLFGNILSANAVF